MSPRTSESAHTSEGTGNVEEQTVKINEANLVEIEIAEEDEDGKEIDVTYYTDDDLNGQMYEKVGTNTFKLVGRFVEGDPEFV